MAYHLIKGFFFVFVLTSCTSSGFLLDTTPTYACVDQQPTCDVFNSSFAVCKDLHHAYQICRKFCGLCNVVHGGWSVWSAWGVCDVTCDNGTMTRTRQCNNPQPLNGGEDCQGPSKNNGECLLNRCPTHGGWSAWNGWGSCSVTCGVGLRRRDRTCDNPWPSSDGNHCFGDNINYEICSERVCATWTDWGSWSSCSDTCGYGLKERYRNCSGTSDSCAGSDVQNVMCKTSCYLTNVLFLARTPKETALTNSQIAIFTTVGVNTGQGYDPNTGKFTAPVSGVYMFAVQYCTEGNKWGCLQIVKNGTVLQSSVHLAGSINTECSSMQAFATVAVGEQVWLKSINTWSSTCSLIEDNRYYVSSFAGVLIHT